MVEVGQFSKILALTNTLQDKLTQLRKLETEIGWLASELQKETGVLNENNV